MNAGLCHDKQTLFGYIMGTISEDEAEAVGRHLASCPECERTADALEGISDTMITAMRQPADGDAYAKGPECGQVLQKLRKLQFGNPGVGRRPPTLPAENKPRRVTRLGDYELLTKLGQGGMGTVYKARHTRLKRVVALKVLPKNRLEDEVAVARFEREMEAVGRLDHPNIVRAMDAREVDKIRFLVMEYVDGLDLSKIVDRCGPLSIADAAETIRQAALGLECSWENGLVHRDVKPSNLMLTAEGQVKVLDLGLAQIQEVESLGEEITGVGQVMGTPDYISPEQALESHTVDIRADVYSLGCTLYCLLAGHPPFVGPDYDTPMKKVTGHIRDTVPPIGALKPDVPKPIARLLERMLVKDPTERIAGPAEVAGVLAPFCKGSKLIGLLREARSQGEQDDGEKSRIKTGEFQASALIDTSRDDPTPDENEADSSTSAPLDPYHRWLGIPPEAQPAHHYRLLGLELFEDDPEVIRDAAARQMAHVRTYQLGPRAEMSQEILNELGAAKACLINRQKKAAYDARLKADQQSEPMNESKPAEPLPAAAEFSVSVEEQVPRIRVARPRFDRDCFNAKKPPAFVWIAAGAAGLFVFLSVVLYITTGKGSIKIVLSDPEADVEVRINGDVIEIAGLGDPIRLRPGGHQLAVTSDSFETYTKSFTVKRGGNPVLEVTLVPLKSAGVVESSAPRTRIAKPGQTPIAASIGSKTSRSEPPLAVAPFDAGEAKRHQQALADSQGLPVERTNSIGMKFVLIPAGEFMMGSPEDDTGKNDNETPQHRVRITRPFYLGVHEVTQEQYEKVMGKNPSASKGPTRPVEQVSWHDAMAFCAKLLEIDPHYEYRLPTEAEWEYACRAGTTTRYICGDDLNPEYAWYVDNSDSETHPVGQKRANGWGLYDILGNVREWCQDSEDNDYYASSPSNDPAGPTTGQRRVFRGGGWRDPASHCQSAKRNSDTPGRYGPNLGFRVAAVRSAAKKLDALKTAVEAERWLEVDPAERKLAKLREQLLDFCRAHYGTPEAIEAAKLMRRVPWRVDALKRKNIDPYELKTAGAGDPTKLPPELVSIIGDSRLKHSWPIGNVAFSSDGRTIAASSGWPGTVVRLWDAATGEEVRSVWQDPGLGDNCVAFSPKGNLLAVGRRDGVCQIWDAANGRLLRTLAGHTARITRPRFSADGGLLATPGDDKLIKVWDVSSGRELKTLKGHSSGVLSVDFHPQGQMLVSGGTNEPVRVWELKTGKEKAKLATSDGRSVCVRFSPNGRQIAVGTTKGLLRIWDGQKFELLHSLQPEESPAEVSQFVYSRDGKTIAAGYREGGVRFWNSQTGQELQKGDPLIDPRSNPSVWSLDVSPDGRLLAEAGRRSSVCLWDLNTRKQVHSFDGHASGLAQAAISFDGRLLASADNGRVYIVWDLATGEPMSKFKHGIVSQRPRGMDFFQDGRLVTSEQDTNRCIKIWNVSNGGVEESQVLQKYWPIVVKASPNGTHLAATVYRSSQEMTQVVFWDLTARKELGLIDGLEADRNALAFSPDGKVLCVGTKAKNGAGNIEFYEVPSKRKLRVLARYTGGLRSPVFSPDGTLLAAGASDGAVTIWEVAGGEVRHKLTSHKSAVSHVAFSRDGQTLAAVDDLGVIHVWAPSTGVLQRTIRIAQHPVPIKMLEFTPDGRHLVTANPNGTFYVLRLGELQDASRKGMGGTTNSRR